MTRIVVAAIVIAAAISLSAQAPVINAVVERRTVSQALSREVQAVADRGAAAWVGYRVPILRSNGTMRTSGTCCGRCRLEPPTELVVLARVEARVLVQLRPVSVDCDIDASGMPLVWLEGARAEDSVAWLGSLVDAPANQVGDRVADAALTAIALHDSPTAVPLLMRLARAGATAHTRRQAMLLLGQSKDPRVVDFFAQILLK